MDFDELLGPNRLSELSNVSELGEDVACMLDGDFSGLMAIHDREEVTMEDIVKFLERAGYNASSDEGDYMLIRTDGNPPTVVEYIYYSL